LNHSLEWRFCGNYDLIKRSYGGPSTYQYEFASSYILHGVHILRGTIILCGDMAVIIDKIPLKQALVNRLL